MNPPHLIHADAAAELTEAVQWYESKRPGLGTELLEQVAHVIQRLGEDPEAGSPLSADRKTRRMLLPRFPYQLVYRIRPEDIVIVAVAHLKRRPRYWFRRR